MQLRIMTHNMWKNDLNRPAWALRGEDCSASARIPGFARVYSETLPDIVGCQEVSAEMARLLMLQLQEKALPYALLAGGDTPILYRCDKLQLLCSEHLVYPETIDGLEGCFNNEATKSYTIAVFQSTEGKRLLFASTHLWWKSGDPTTSIYQPFSDEARAWQLALLRNRVLAVAEQHGCPAIIAGDLNADYRSAAVQDALLNGWQHAHDISLLPADESMGYHSCGPDGYEMAYRDEPFEAGIDHILCKGLAADAVQSFMRYAPPYYLPLSDHCPAWADILL